MESPWGELRVSDAHVHFFSHRFFASIADQTKSDIASLGRALGWVMPDESAANLSELWVHELDRRGVSRAALIASVPGDHRSVMEAVQRFPQRFYGYAMVNPLLNEAAETIEPALASGFLHALCLFPAMHRYSMHDERVLKLLDMLAGSPRTVVFVHCGVLSVGIRAKLGLP